MTRTVIARAPTRIDFGGGWTDVPPYSDEAGGFVCNVAISRYATVRVSEPATTDASLKLQGGSAGDRAIADAAARRLGVEHVEIEIHNDFPVGAGLGGSSAAGVAAIAALAAHAGQLFSPRDLAELSRTIETEDLGISGGRQDHYAAVFGGALALRFEAGAVHVRRIPLTSHTREQLERRCIVIYTGQSRISGDTINAVMDAYRARSSNVVVALRRMSELAEQTASALEGGDIDTLAELVDEQWNYQRSLHPAIPTPLIDTIIERAHAAGSSGAKALGASGGGCVLVIAPEDRIVDVRDAIAPFGDILPFAIDEHGVAQCT